VNSLLLPVFYLPIPEMCGWSVKKCTIFGDVQLASTVAGEAGGNELHDATDGRRVPQIVVDGEPYFLAAFGDALAVRGQNIGARGQSTSLSSRACSSEASLRATVAWSTFNCGAAFARDSS
jgi:hypothetical protein